MTKQSPHKYWHLFTSLILGFGLIIGLAFIVSAQVNAASQAPKTINGNTITVTTTDDELNGDGDCSLREAVQAANIDSPVSGCDAGSGWDTIIVPAGTYILTLAGADEDNNTTGDLDILESVTIQGDGSNATIVDGNTIDRVFDINPNEADAFSFYLEDVQITNGAEEFGAGLFITATHTILQDVELVAGTAVTNGGAIYGVHSRIEILNSQILTNTANEGGGIYLADGSLTLINTIVSGNSATEYGGGIYSENAALALESGSEIANNQAENAAGLYSDDDAHLIIRDSHLHHNIVTVDGGAAIIDSSANWIENTTIEHNQAQVDGGGLYIDEGTTIISSTIRHNNTVDNGGGIYIDGSGSAIISSTVVYSNTADEGGGIYLYGNGLYIAKSIFRENAATSEGGGIYLYDEGGIIIEDSLFESNAADFGGAIVVLEESAMSIDRSTFISNTATSDGGAIYTCCSDYTYTTIRNSTLTQNSAGNEGGAAYSYFLGIMFENSTIVNNTAGTAGGGFANPDYFGYFYNTILAGNNVAGDESHEYADCYIDSYKLQSGGHNLFGESTGCDEYRYDSTIPVGDVFVSMLEPLADNGGGILPDGTHPQSFLLKSGSPAIDFANDDNCPLVDQTGANRIQGNACDTGATESSENGTVPVFTDNIINVDTTVDELNSDGDCSLREAIEAAETNTVVDTCESGDGWDTILLPSGTYSLTIENYSIVSETVTIRGTSAANSIIHGNDEHQIFYVRRNGGLFLEDVTLTHGYDINDGGCIEGSYGFVNIIDSVLSHCKADEGGAIEMYGHLNMIRSTVKENEATGTGGGIYNYYGMVTIKDSTILENIGSGYGAGIGAYVGLTRISNSDILSNTGDSDAYAGGVAGAYGILIVNEESNIQHNQTDSYCGGAYGYDIAMLIEDSTISHNQALEEGGGLCTDDGAWVRNTLIEYNISGEEGGGIHGGGLIENSTIRHNKALSITGGGIFSWGILKDSIVTDNQAAEGGGITTGGGAMIMNSTIRDNETFNDIGTGNGGGVFFDDHAGHIENSTIEGNISAGNGGGLFINDMADTTVVNSTISGNDSLLGAGAYILTGTLAFDYSTVAANTASGEGGGLHNADMAVVQSSIIAGNSGNGSNTDSAADCASNADITYAGNSLFGDGTGCAATGQNDMNVNPDSVFTSVIKPLADYGGDTETHELQASSPAIDTGNLQFCQDSDQRGYARPIGSACDTGSVEVWKMVFLPVIMK